MNPTRQYLVDKGAKLMNVYACSESVGDIVSGKFLVLADVTEHSTLLDHVTHYECYDPDTGDFIATIRQDFLFFAYVVDEEIEP